MLWTRGIAGYLGIGKSESSMAYASLSSWRKGKAPTRSINEVHTRSARRKSKRYTYGRNSLGRSKHEVAVSLFRNGYGPPYTLSPSRADDSTRVEMSRKSKLSTVDTKDYHSSGVEDSRLSYGEYINRIVVKDCYTSIVAATASEHIADSHGRRSKYGLSSTRNTVRERHRTSSRNYHTTRARLSSLGIDEVATSVERETISSVATIPYIGKKRRIGHMAVDSYSGNVPLYPYYTVGKPTLKYDGTKTHVATQHMWDTRLVDLRTLHSDSYTVWRHSRPPYPSTSNTSTRHHHRRPYDYPLLLPSTTGLRDPQRPKQAPQAPLQMLWPLGPGLRSSALPIARWTVLLQLRHTLMLIFVRTVVLSAAVALEDGIMTGPFATLDPTRA